MPASNDTDILFAAVREAGALAQTLFRQQVRNWPKADGSLVSEADLKVDGLLAGLLQKARPSYGWISEESPEDPKRRETPRVWIVDPIDGTRSFLRGGDEWCVAAALVEDGRPVLSAIYRPMFEEFFSAVKGEGAFLNGKRISVSDREGLSDARVMGTRKSLEQLTNFGISPQLAVETPLLLRMARVASGELDGATSVGSKNDWDLAAGDLLVHEAGGKVSTRDGATMRYNRENMWQNGLLAAGAKRHALMLQALAGQ